MSDMTLMENVEDSEHSDDAPYPELARLAREIVAKQFGVKGKGKIPSARHIKDRAKIGLSHTTINTILSGGKVEPLTIDKFAKAFSTSPNPLRYAMGLEPVEWDSEGRKAPDLHSIRDEIKLKDGRSVIISGFDAAREDKEIVKSLIRRFMQAV